jgi:hypothetical protein
MSEIGKTAVDSLTKRKDAAKVAILLTAFYLKEKTRMPDPTGTNQSVQRSRLHLERGPERELIVCSAFPVRE